MNEHIRSRTSRAARWVRGYWPDRNPLRRATDRAEAMLIGVLALGFLGLAPVAAVAVNHWAAAASQAAARAARYEVRAVLTGGAPDPIRYSGLARFSAPATWVSPAGTVRTGQVPVTAGSRAGSTVLIWIDKSGRLVRSAAELGSQGLAAALAVVLGAAMLAYLAASLARRFLHGRRMAAWDADWRATEPRWSRRRRP